jgi:hypothetical protein
MLSLPWSSLPYNGPVHRRANTPAKLPISTLNLAGQLYKSAYPIWRIPSPRRSLATLRNDLTAESRKCGPQDRRLTSAGGGGGGGALPRPSLTGVLAPIVAYRRADRKRGRDGCINGYMLARRGGAPPRAHERHRPARRIRARTTTARFRVQGVGSGSGGLTPAVNLQAGSARSRPLLTAEQVGERPVGQSRRLDQAEPPREVGVPTRVLARAGIEEVRNRARGSLENLPAV